MLKKKIIVLIGGIALLSGISMINTSNINQNVNNCQVLGGEKFLEYKNEIADFNFELSNFNFAYNFSTAAFEPDIWNDILPGAVQSKKGTLDSKYVNLNENTVHVGENLLDGVMINLGEVKLNIGTFVYLGEAASRTSKEIFGQQQDLFKGFILEVKSPYSVVFPFKISYMQYNPIIDDTGTSINWWEEDSVSDGDNTLTVHDPIYDPVSTKEFSNFLFFKLPGSLININDITFLLGTDSIYQENNINWIIEPTYNLQLDKLYGEFKLDYYSDNVEVIHTNKNSIETNTITPQYDPDTQIYSFFTNPFVNTNSNYYYGFEDFEINVNDVSLDSKELLLTNFDPYLVANNANSIYVSSDTAIIEVESDGDLLNWMEANEFTITMDVNEIVTTLSYDEIRSGDVALTGLSSSTNYELKFYVNDVYGNGYLNSAVSFTTK